MPRKKKQNNAHYPIGLTSVKVRGKKRFRYRTAEQKDFYFPIETLEIHAIEAATQFNRKYRNPSIDLLLDKSNGKLLLKDWLPLVVKRVEQEELNPEKLSPDVFQTFKLDVARLNESHGNIIAKEINLDTVNSYLNTHHKNPSNNVYNAKLSFLKKVFAYLMDEGVIDSNFAERKKLKPKPDKIQVRLDKDAYDTLLRNAEPFLNIAMRLSYQTTHAVNEVSKIKYSDCIWFTTSKVDSNSNLLVYGEMYIHRIKTKRNDASRVAIPITEKIKTIIEDSKLDNVTSPYIVHRKKLRKTNRLAKGMTHETQVRNADISEGFSELRDELDLYSDLEKDERPTFHEIRSLSIFNYDQIGVDPQKRAAHSDPRTTKKYKEGHVKWTEVEAAELED